MGRQGVYEQRGGEGDQHLFTAFYMPDIILCALFVSHNNTVM